MMIVTPNHMISISQSLKSRMIFHGLPMPVLVKWILLFLIREEGRIQNWVDLGSGSGETLKAIGVIPCNGVAVDIFKHPIEIPGFSLSKGTIGDFLVNPSNGGGLVTLFDVVEHFEKQQAIRLLRILTKRFSTQIIFTPDGFLRQDGYTCEQIIDSPFMWHRCGFCVDEFERLGYLVLVLKRYHGTPAGNEKTFNALLAFKKNTFGRTDYEKLLLNVRSQYLKWLLHPRNAINSMRVRLRIPFRQSTSWTN